MNNWAYNLDMLAQNGVLDFDAPSFIMDQAPRYIGSPSAPPSPYVGPPYVATPQINQPQVDEFKKEEPKTPPKEEQDKNLVKTPMWKKVLFGALAVTTIGVGIWKFKSAVNWAKNSLNKINWKSTKDFFVDKGKAIGNFFKNCWHKFTGLFKKKP